MFSLIASSSNEIHKFLKRDHIINRNFSLTKNDLFAYNINDNSDNNFYFLIVDGIDDEERWILGIPFLKKYVISYDFDSKTISYYENYGKINDDGSDDKPKEDTNFFN